MPRDPGNWLSHNAGDYDNLRRGERRAIHDFLFLWSLFEAQVHEANASLPKVFEKISTWDTASALEVDSTTECWIYFSSRLMHGEKFSHHIQGLNIQRDQDREFLKTSLKSPNISLLDMHKSLSIIVYRIRNNLMHGEKWAYGIGDQQLNFEHCNEMLMVWMDIARSLGH